MRSSCDAGLRLGRAAFGAAGATTIETRVNPFRQPLDHAAHLAYSRAGARSHFFPASKNGYFFGFVFPPCGAAQLLSETKSPHGAPDEGP